MIRVHILDKCPIFILGLTSLLHDQGIRVVGTRTCPATTFDWLVDVALVDPEVLDPERSAQYIGDLSKLNPVLLVTSRAQRTAALGLIQAGACGVVTRSEPPETIIEAIRTVVSGATWAGPAAREPATDGDGPPGRPASLLSAREEQVLRQISSGLTHSQVARRLGISRHTVDTYVKRIRTKLGVGNKAELTRAAVLGSFMVRP